MNRVAQACQSEVLSATGDAGRLWGERGGGLIYGPVAGQHLTYWGEMLVNEWANEAAELTTQDPSSKTHALCEPQTTDRVTQRKQRSTIALRMLHS